MKKKVKNVLKAVVVSPLLITILGSALWEKFLSPFCTRIYVQISSWIDNFVTTFSNNTYKKIAEGYNVPATDNYVFYFILIVIILLYLGAMYENIKKIVSDIDENCKFDKYLVKKHLLSVVIIIGVQIPMLFSMYFLGNYTFIDNCKTSSLCNLEIVSPYISDLEYKELKSAFYSIQTKEDYEAFINTINEVGEKYSLNLRK